MSTQYRCSTQERREAVRAARRDGQPFLNGIDFLEVVSADQQTLEVHFIHNLPGAATDPVPNTSFTFSSDKIAIEGGVRVRNVRVIDVLRTADNVLTVNVAPAGDFSPYTLRLQRAADDPEPPEGFDPQLAAIEFGFKVTCANDFDCEPVKVCPPEPLREPEINYLAKDYASFRRLMLDRLAVLLPQWQERHAADLGITLVEVLAYVADRLSYEQDAIATEAYLGTARRRVSVRRHTRLVDYFMHDGCNARVWVQVRVDANPPILPKGTKLLTRVPNLANRITSAAEYQQALAAGAEVFETMAPADLNAAHNLFNFYTWGARECCLPAGATRATLTGHYPDLNPGAVLIFQEMRGPQTGEEEDADVSHRHAVRLIRVIRADRHGNNLTDPLSGQQITEIEWHAEDALPFPLCISSVTDKQHGAQFVADVSIALGNIVLADHGSTLDEPEPLGAVPRSTLYRVPTMQAMSSPTGPLNVPDMPDEDGPEARRTLIPPRFRPRLANTPLTQAAPYPYASDEAPLKSARVAMNWEMRTVMPALLELRRVLDEDTDTWEAKRDLLNSDRSAREVVVEVEHDGTAYLRFGDGTYGQRPPAGSVFSAIYRVGNGTYGNIGANMIAHIVSNFGEIRSVTNALPARGGTEPESVEQVRQSAPQAFRTQDRAVTLGDYATVAQGHPQVQRAAATVRWTGSWPTIFLTVDTFGGARVEATLEQELRQYLERFRMAGHDLEIDAPQLVPLEIDMQVCVEPTYFRSHVRTALLQIFSNRALPDGRRGVFHPDNFTFGQTIYLSTLYAAAEAVDGVASVRITKFQRQGAAGTNELSNGRLTLNRLEIASLDNDPNFPDRGVFRLTVEGGK